MTEKKKKHPGGRPTKFTSRFIEVANQVLNTELNSLIFTDEELLIQINELLEDSERITDTTFQNWKAGKCDSVGKQFFVLYKKAFDLQKFNLFKKLQSGKAGEWQKYAWIIERKFKDWNMTQYRKVDSSVKIKQDKIDRDAPVDELVVKLNQRLIAARQN